MNFRMPVCVVFGLMWMLFQPPSVLSDSVDLNNLSSEQQSLIDEHVFGGIPGTKNIYARKGFILCYNPVTKTPDWVAYHVKPDYRKTPERKGKFSSFRKDPDIAGESSTDDYVGLKSVRGYARAHLAPYGVMAGDRDGNGKYAVYDSDNSDEDDELTVKQAN